MYVIKQEQQYGEWFVDSQQMMDTANYFERHLPLIQFRKFQAQVLQ